MRKPRLKRLRKIGEEFSHHLPTAIRQAAKDLEMVYKSEDHKINMYRWFEEKEDICYVCLAGSVLARRYPKSMIENSCTDGVGISSTQKNRTVPTRSLNLFNLPDGYLTLRLMALDELRVGNFERVLALFNWRYKDSATPTEFPRIVGAEDKITEKNLKEMVASYRAAATWFEKFTEPVPVPGFSVIRGLRENYCGRHDKSISEFVDALNYEIGTSGRYMSEITYRKYELGVLQMPYRVLSAFQKVVSFYHTEILAEGFHVTQLDGTGVEIMQRAILNSVYREFQERHYRKFL